MELSKRHQQFLRVEQCAIPTLSNLVLNGLIVWVLNRSVPTIPLWGQPSIAVDLLATAFFLPFLICVIVSPQIKGKVKSGKLPPLPLDQIPPSRWFRRSTWMRGLLLGILGVLFGALPVVWALSLGQAQPFPMPSFVAFKAVWAAMLASLVSPVIGWWALASASRPSLVTRRSKSS